MGRVLPLFQASCYSFCAVLSVRLCGFADCSASDTCICFLQLLASVRGGSKTKKKKIKNANGILSWDWYKNTLQGWYVWKWWRYYLTSQEPEQTSLLSPHTKAPPSNILSCESSGLFLNNHRCLHFIPLFYSTEPFHWMSGNPHQHIFITDPQ